jgi:hypothetical protein
MGSTRLLALASTLAASLGASTIIGAPAAQAAPTQVLWYKFDNHSLGAQPTTFTNSGTLGTTVTSTVYRKVATSPNADLPATIVNGVSDASGAFPSGRAIDLPPYQVLSSGPSLSVIGIRNNLTTGTDPMNPGTGNFTWKADFSLDDQLGSQSTDGDNIVQRGLYSDTGYMWKMSADGHKFVCAVKPPGTVDEIKTPAITIPNKTSNRSWYRGYCNRSAAGVLSATLNAYDKAQRAWVSVKTATMTGAGVDFTKMPKSTAVSIGGKLNTSWTGINTDPDQFNGVVDNVALTVG